MVIGGLAQLARALAWHARGHRFDSDILHLRAYSPTGHDVPSGSPARSLTYCTRKEKKESHADILSAQRSETNKSKRGRALSGASEVYGPRADKAGGAVETDKGA